MHEITCIWNIQVTSIIKEMEEKAAEDFIKTAKSDAFRRALEEQMRELTDADNINIKSEKIFTREVVNG